MGVVYLRKNLINGMMYVGQTKNIIKRNYQWRALNHRYANLLLTEDRIKYGLDNFETIILQECETEEELNRWEKHYIKFFNTLYPNGYNDNEGGRLSFHHSERTKAKISKKNKGENNGMFGKNVWNKGKKGCFSEETRKKMSEAAKGNKSALGHIVSEESREINRKKHLGFPNIKNAIPIVQLTLEGKFVRYWEGGAAEAARELGFNTINISKCCRGERKQHKGFKWMKKSNYEEMLAGLSN